MILSVRDIFFILTAVAVRTKNSRWVDLAHLRRAVKAARSFIPSPCHQKDSTMVEEFQNASF